MLAISSILQAKQVANCSFLKFKNTLKLLGVTAAPKKEALADNDDMQFRKYVQVVETCDAMLCGRFLWDFLIWDGFRVWNGADSSMGRNRCYRDSCYGYRGEWKQLLQKRFLWKWLLSIQTATMNTLGTIDGCYGNGCYGIGRYVDDCYGKKQLL
ncbi:hypothetical protein HUJ04_005340 [Dendroctonus ponderosae]|nr:hypothetical protein HUJ04_005340 [Dendroctonus ponderosae]